MCCQPGQNQDSFTFEQTADGKYQQAVLCQKGGDIYSKQSAYPVGDESHRVPSRGRKVRVWLFI